MYNAICRFGVPALLLFVGTLAAQQPGDLIKQAEQKRQIEAQRLEVLVADTLRKTREIGPRDQQRAIQLVKAAIAELQADKDALTDAKRAELLRKLDQDLQAWGARAEIR